MNERMTVDDARATTELLRNASDTAVDLLARIDAEVDKLLPQIDALYPDRRDDR